MGKLKIGVIGLGSIAHIAQLPVLASLDNVELTACAARTELTVSSVASRFGFLKKYTALEEMISDSGIEAAFVLTSKESHQDIVLPLLKNGIHVFCEKPMTMSISKSKEMVHCAEENKRILMIGFNRRYAPVYEKAKRTFDGKAPDVCVAFKNRPGTEYRATMENAIHMLDIMRWFCGECVHIEAHAHYDDPDYETTTAALLRFDSGAIGLFLGNRTCGQWTERLELYGDGKSVLVDCPDSITIVDSEQEHTTRMTPINMGWASVQEKMGFRQEVIHFIDCIKTGSEPKTSGRDALKTHILLDQVLRKANLPGMEL
jgi:virulence factor